METFFFVIYSRKDSVFFIVSSNKHVRKLKLCLTGVKCKISSALLLTQHHFPVLFYLSQ